MSLVVSEIFGPTFQGEGPSAGRAAMFLRLGRCNLACRWCDTPYTWDWERFDPGVELHTISIDGVVSQLTAIGAPMLVITGGEPLLQQSRLEPLLDALPPSLRIEVETNGTLAPSPALAARVDQWNVSPKLANSGDTAERRIAPAALGALVRTGRAIAKFVVQSVDELDEAGEIVAGGGFEEVWVMPEGTSGAVLDERAASLAPAVLARGWNLSTRLHVHLWGDRRGV